MHNLYREIHGPVVPQVKMINALPFLVDINTIPLIKVADVSQMRCMVLSSDSGCH